MEAILIMISIVLFILGSVILWAVKTKKVNKLLKDTAGNSLYLMEFGLIPLVFVLIVNIVLRIYKLILPKKWLYPAIQGTMTILGLGCIILSIVMWFVN